MGRLRRLVATAVVLLSCCRGAAVPRLDLGQAMQVSDAIVVGRVVSGRARADQAGISAELRVTVVRTLKGNLIPGATVAIGTRGPRLKRVRPAPRPPVTWVVKPFTALWFLRGEHQPYAAAPGSAGSGEPECACLWLPEESRGASVDGDVNRAVAEEVVAALRTMAAAHSGEIRPVYHVQAIGGKVDRSYQTGELAQRALRLSDALATLGHPPTLAAVYRELASDPSVYLRGIGIAGTSAVRRNRRLSLCLHIVHNARFRLGDGPASAFSSAIDGSVNRGRLHAIWLRHGFTSSELGRVGPIERTQSGPGWGERGAPVRD